ncbi:non-ribosomal peptide synthetase [Saccharothrix texasensis]|uniref:Amino acid adenylation domain-containing protein n=1 Tax=Saccharothrix texasensis TaxID=103734 RepID=A0A3N1HI74_9PSEU|nr:non-ribosomal peptide synthetase [Saccharothrix texasensis]ROP42186.1 amino acid adenylation domain-containing protein [Saccharothrix texasensis]
MTSSAEVKKDLLRYLLMQVKQEALDVDRAKGFIRAIGDAGRVDDRVAVVGIACRFPGASDKEQFWRNLVDGRESIGDFPPQRLEDLRRVEGGTEAVRKGGYLDRVDLFDAEYFGIPPHVATQLDPYHRNLLEVLVETMEDAGYAKSELYGSNTGVFVGNDHTHRLITSYLPFLSELDFSAITGSWSGILASRLSYLLDFRGPATVIDTGCSSGLVAVDAAIKALRNGDCDTAFVAAINLFLSPSSLGNETESAEHRVRAFDASADGTVWSEGVAGVYLKPLSRALADGDHVYGVLLGSAVNNDGRSNGLTAPNAQAQKNLLVSAWKRAGIAPESVSYIEAHGTGTTLGDPIEIKGLTSAFAEFTDRRQFCALGSVKTNIGHTVGVAGLASLIKALLCLERRTIPPSIHFDVPNRLLDLANAPVYVADRLTEWEAGDTPRRAGVSSFSLSGTNCHVVLEEAPTRAATADPARGPRLYPISARTEELLARTAAAQLAHLDRHPGHGLADVCFTMQVGREHQAARAVVLCETVEGLRDGLRRLLDPDQADDTRLVDGGVLLREVPSSWPGDLRHLADAATAFLAGRARPFAGLGRDADVRRVPLPPQLFHHVRLWDETVRAQPAPGVEEQASADPVDRLRVILAAPPRLDGLAESDVDAVPRKVVAGVWSEVLGYPVIRGADDFFALGGDSISSVKITQLLNAVLDVDIPPTTLLAKPTFDGFADAVVRDFGVDERLVRSRLGGSARRPAPAARVLEDYELPLTASQRSMFVSSQVDEDSVAYNVSGLTIRTGPLDVAELEEWLRVLVRRHDSLRSTFHLRDGEPFQRVRAEVPVAVEHRRLGALAEGDAHEDAARREMRRFVRPFLLDTAPLFRVGYFEFDDGVSCVAIDIHHIVTDGTSMGILFRDLGAIAEGKALPPVRDHRSAIRGLLARQAGDDVRPHRDYWVSRFADGAPTLQLTTDRQRAETATAAGATLFASVDGETLQAAKRCAREHDVTLYVVLLGVFHQLLSRLSGQGDVVVGAPVMGRPDLTYQDLVGMFVTTLPLRVAAAPTTGVGDFLGDLRTTVLEAFEHQEYPLEALVEELDPPRVPGRRPLFDVCFVHQNTDMGLTPDDERVIPFDDGSAKYDITLSTREADGALLLEWEYSTALFREETMALYAERYATLLRSFVTAADDDPLGGLDLVSAREAELIREFATVPAPPVDTRGIARLFEEHVAADPERTALITDDERLSYGELNVRANRVAHSLARLGVTPGSPVALLVDRSADMVVAILGVLKARCHYVPLNTEFPAERLRVMVRDVGAGILLTTGARSGQAAELISERLRIVDLAALAGSRAGTGNPDLPGSSADEVYIMYTSGTTGVPKGSVIRQRSVLRVVHRSVFYAADPSDVFLMISDYSFDGSVYDMFGALTNGASLVLPAKESVLDLDRLGATIERHGVTSFFITTAMFNAMVDHVPGSLGSVRKVIFGGEIASPVHVKRAFDLLGPGRIGHAYGPTETTVFATVHTLDSLDQDDAVPIGRAVGDTSLWVLDERLRPVPIGVSGELHIGGGGVADGYLNQPELTAERFVRVPSVPGERLYKTGDIVTFKSNGLLYYTGRVDQQIKLRGYRIELAEIIQVALDEPGVRWAHAGLHETAEGSRSLCLWVGYEAGREHDEPVLRAALARRLPDYMVPPFIVRADEVPLNASGKVDVAALPKPDFTAAASAAAPETDSLRVLADAWRHVLGVPVDDIDANFFALGGDSIKAIQIVARLKERDVAVRVADLLGNATLRTLDEKVAEAAGAGAGPRVYDPAPLSGPITPSPIQQSFLDDLGDRAPVFNQCLLVTPATPAPLDRLVRAAQRLVRHHDLLRVEVDDRGGLNVRDVDTPSLVHGEQAPAGLSGADLAEYLRTVQSRVDVRGGPVVSLAAGLGEGRGQFAIAIHHLAVDVVSWGVVLEDLLAWLADPDAEAPAKTMPFPEWTAEVRRRARDGVFRAQLPYWLDVARTAGDAGEVFAETDLARSETATTVVRLAEADDFSLLDAAREAHGVSAAETVLTVVARALASVTGRNRVLLTLEGHGREPIAGDHDLSRTVGWFTSTFPHLVRVERGVGDTLDAVRHSFERLPDKGAGFGPLLRFDSGLGEDRVTLAAVRPRVCFNYLGGQDSADGADGVAVTHLPADITTDAEVRSPHALDILASRSGRDLLVEVRHPRSWESSGLARQVAEAVDRSFHEVRDALKSGGPRGFQVSSPIRQDVLADILLDVAGGS